MKLENWIVCPAKNNGFMSLVIVCQYSKRTSRFLEIHVLQNVLSSIEKVRRTHESI